VANLNIRFSSNISYELRTTVADKYVIVEINYNSIFHFNLNFHAIGTIIDYLQIVNKY